VRDQLSSDDGFDTIEITSGPRPLVSACLDRWRPLQPAEAPDDCPLTPTGARRSRRSSRWWFDLRQSAIAVGGLAIGLASRKPFTAQ
jgi:hypothetical protein